MDNIGYIKQQLSALLGNTSSFVKFICISTLIGYCLSYSEKAVLILSITPEYLLPPTFWFWTLFTYFFIELHFWEVFVDLICIGLCGKLIEPLWGQMEMLIFFAITNTFAGIMTTFYYLFYSMLTQDTEILFNIHIHGLTGVNAAISVAVTQIMPNQLIARTPLGKFSNRNVPLTVLTFAIILWAIGILDGTYPAMFCSGLYVSWVYLRFYQRHSNGSKGDSADNFRLASFFPNVLQPFITVIVNPVYLCCLRIGMVKRLSVQSNQTSLQSVSVMSSYDQHDMERRRQIALKALSERLAKTSAPDSSRSGSTVPAKTFPQQASSSSKSSHHTHQHHSHNSHGHHHGQPQLNPAFIDMINSSLNYKIPLPPPPSMNVDKTTNDSNLINLDTKTKTTQEESTDKLSVL